MAENGYRRIVMTQVVLRALLVCLLIPASVLAASPTLNITGGSDALQDNIRSYLDVGSRSCQLSRWHQGSFTRDLDESISNAGRALGFYRMQFETEMVQEDDCWSLNVSLTPGPQVTYQSITTSLEGEGKDNPVLLQALASTSMALGKPLNHAEYENYKSKLLHAASGQGYFDATFVRSEVLVTSEQDAARVTVILETGQRYRIGDITVTHDILSDKLINRYVNIQEGQDYQSEKLVELKSQLLSSNYFGSVTVEPRLNELADGEVPVSIDLSAGPRHSYSAGVGYTSDIGPRILLGYENRYLNDAGHNLDVTVNASEVITTYQVGYTIPLQRPAFEFLRVFTGYSQEEINRSVSNKLATGVNYSSWETSRWLNNLALSYEEEEYMFGDDPSSTSELIIPMYSTTYSYADSIKYPRRGWSVFARVKGADDSLGSSTDFAQVYGRLKWILLAASGRLLFRVEGGLTEVDDFSKLPISQRFFAGGDASVRGYDYKTLGPRNDDDVVVGGSRLITGSVEYDQKVYGDFVLAAFYDEGSAFDKGYLDRYRGVGVGFRWLSPVGPVRADIARALDGPESWRLHLSVGPDL